MISYYHRCLMNQFRSKVRHDSDFCSWPSLTWSSLSLSPSSKRKLAHGLSKSISVPSNILKPEQLSRCSFLSNLCCSLELFLRTFILISWTLSLLDEGVWCTYSLAWSLSDSDRLEEDLCCVLCFSFCLLPKIVCSFCGKRTIALHIYHVGWLCRGIILSMPSSME